MSWFSKLLDKILHRNKPAPVQVEPLAPVAVAPVATTPLVVVSPVTVVVPKPTVVDIPVAKPFSPTGAYNADGTPFVFPMGYTTPTLTPKEQEATARLAALRAAEEKADANKIYEGPVELYNMSLEEKKYLFAKTLQDNKDYFSLLVHGTKQDIANAIQEASVNGGWSYDTSQYNGYIKLQVENYHG